MSKRSACLSTLWLPPALAVLTACTGIPLKEHETREATLYHQYAGEPIDHFTYLGRYDGWTVIGQHELVVWTTMNDAYLITVLPPCEDLLLTNRIGLTQTQHSVYQKFDFVKTHGWTCMIKSIQPVNYLQMRRDLRQKTADAKAAEKAAAEQAKKE